MSEKVACSAYRQSDRQCLNGFITNAACRGTIGCPTCGRDSSIVPMCCNEEWSARLLERTGGKPDWDYVQRNREIIQATPKETPHG